MALPMRTSHGTETENKVINTVRKAAPILMLAVVALAGCKSSTAASPVQSAKANPTVSADAAKAKAQAEAIINNCAVQLGGTKGSGITALLSLPVLRQLATHAGRVKFETCAFPSPAKRAAASTCIQQATSGAGLGLLKSSGRHQAAQNIFNCVETNL
jgi:hypothetical protein